MRTKWERIRMTLFLVSIALTVLAFAAVSFLTAQSGQATLSTQERVVLLFPAAFRKHFHNRLWLHLELNSPRRLAHIYEFGFLGIFATLAMLTAPWPRRARQHLSGRNVSIRLVLTVALCAAVSFLDQVHKIFVEYRHFDVLDLRLDAIGYVGAALLVTLLYLTVTHRILQRTGSLLEEASDPESGRRAELS